MFVLFRGRRPSYVYSHCRQRKGRGGSIADQQANPFIDGRRGSRGYKQTHSYLKKANAVGVAACIHFFNVTAVNNLSHVPVLIGQVFS
jgi:hypothetical protein